MVFEGIVDSVVNLVLVVGFPLIVLLFYLDGLVIGKLFQPGVVFITVVAVTRPTWSVLLILSGACVLSVVAGQWTLYQTVNDGAPSFFDGRRSSKFFETLPDRIIGRVGERRFSLIERSFVEHGSLTIVVATFLPWVRGTIAIPAGMSSYTTGRFVMATFVGNAPYVVALVAVALGILQLLGLR